MRSSLFALLALVCIGLTLAEINPPSPAIGAEVPVTYFGPAPSSVLKELVGPYQLIRSGTVDMTTDPPTVTLPLYHGSLSTDPSYNIWYIVTDSNDRENAESLGINFSAKLAYADTGNAVRTGRIVKGGEIQFDAGTVDFSGDHSVTPGPNAFPLTAATPGSVGDAAYSPLVKVRNAQNTIYNAPIIAGNVPADTLQQFENATTDASRRFLHDKVVRISPKDFTVTLRLTQGFSFGKPILYLSTDANNDQVAALEFATYAPALNDITIGRDDTLFSPVERLFAVVNGYTNSDRPSGATEANHPLRQGLISAIRDGRDPLNVFGGIPTVATDYSPLWDMNLGQWTQYAVNSNYRTRWLDEFQILAFVENGFVENYDGTEFGSSGFIVNCPPVMRLL